MIEALFDAWTDPPAPEDWDADWKALFQRCESPIERRMCREIRGRLGYPAMAGRCLEDKVRFHALLADHGAVVFGQQQVGRYRPDFLVAMYAPGWRHLSVAAIECDGWEFHGSDDAKARDAVRDGELSGYGLKVIRFSGHEIVRKPDQVLGRIPHEMGARPAEYWLWGKTQRELHPGEEAA